MGFCKKYLYKKYKGIIKKKVINIPETKYYFSISPLLEIKIRNKIDNEQKCHVYYPEKTFFIAFCRELLKLLFDKYDYFVYVYNEESLNFLLSLLNNKKIQILVFDESDLVCQYSNKNINIVHLDTVLGIKDIDLTESEFNISLLERNISILHNNYVNYNEIFNQFGYLLKNIKLYIKSDLPHKSSQNEKLNVLSLLPRAAISKGLIENILADDCKAFLKENLLYQYNQQICLNYFFIDSTFNNVINYMNIIIEYENIEWNDLIEIIIFLCKNIKIQNYVLNSVFREKFIVLLKIMMTHKDYNSYEKKIKLILDELLNIKILKNLANMYIAFYESDLENYDDAIKKLNKLLNSKDQYILYQSAYRIAYCYMMKREELDKAKMIFKKLIKCKNKGDLAGLYNNLGLVYYYQGRYRQAKRAYENCKKYLYLSFQEKKDRNRYNNNYALLLMELGEYDKCRIIFENLIYKNHELYDNKPLQYLSDEYDNLGNIYLYMQMYKEAEECFMNSMIRAETLNSRLISEENYLYAMAKANVDSFDELYLLEDKCNNDTKNYNIDKAQSYYMIVELYFERKKYQEAANYLEKSYVLQRENKQIIDMYLTKIIIDYIKVKNEVLKVTIFKLKYSLLYIYHLVRFSKDFYLCIMIRKYMKEIK